MQILIQAELALQTVIPVQTTRGLTIRPEHVSTTVTTLSPIYYPIILLSNVFTTALPTGTRIGPQLLQNVYPLAQQITMLATVQVLVFAFKHAPLIQESLVTLLAGRIFVWMSAGQLTSEIKLEIDFAPLLAQGLISPKMTHKDCVFSNAKQVLTDRRMFAFQTLNSARQDSSEMIQQTYAFHFAQRAKGLSEIRKASYACGCAL
jgi:hypothetical protein